MKFTIAATVACLSALVAAAPGTTAVPAGYGGAGGGGGDKSTCYPYTYYFTSSGWTEYPSTSTKIESSPYTKVITEYKTIDTCIPTKIKTQVLATSTGNQLTTKTYVTKVKSSWTSVKSEVKSTCKAGGGGGSGGYGSY